MISYFCGRVLSVWLVICERTQVAKGEATRKKRQKQKMVQCKGVPRVEGLF
jgi:hypothetical protein